MPQVSVRARIALVEEVLAAADARKTAMRLAADHAVSYAALWQWSVEEAQRRALDIGVEELRSGLSSHAAWLALLARCQSDPTGCALTRLEQLQLDAEVHEAELRYFWRFFPAERGDAATGEWILSRRDCPEDVLREALEAHRGLTRLAHRAGPKWLLEGLLSQCPHDEPALTLLRDYYATDDYSVGETLRFLRSLPQTHRDACQRAARRWPDFPEDKFVASQMDVELSAAVRLAHQGGRPNGWLLGWDRSRHYESFVRSCAGYRCGNITSFDYEFAILSRSDSAVELRPSVSARASSLPLRRITGP